MRHNIVFLDRATVGVPLRTPGFDHDYREYAATTAEQAAERLRGATTIAIVNKVPLRDATLAQLPDLRLVALADAAGGLFQGHAREHGPEQARKVDHLSNLASYVDVLAAFVEKTIRRFGRA